MDEFYRFDESNAGWRMKWTCQEKADAQLSCICIKGQLPYDRLMMNLCPGLITATVINYKKSEIFIRKTIIAVLHTDVIIYKYPS